MNPILEDEKYGTELICWYHIRTKPSILGNILRFNKH